MWCNLLGITLDRGYSRSLGGRSAYLVLLAVADATSNPTTKADPKHRGLERSQTPSQSGIQAHSSEGENKEDNSFEKYEVADKRTVVAGETLILMCLYPGLAQRV